MADATIAAIQAVNAAISGVTSAPTDEATYAFPVPDELLPYVVCLPARMEADRIPTTTYECRVLVAKVDTATQTAALGVAVSLMRAFRAAYKPLGAINGYAILKQPPTATGGTGSPRGLTQTVAWAGAEYIGFLWLVTLAEAP
jgi:hypothetical protein